MENSTENKTEVYHSVLQKFINLALFGKLVNPKFSKENEEIKIHRTLSDFFKSLHEKSDVERNEIISQFYDEKLVNFRKKIKDKDLVDLMNCFGFSNFRIIINLLRMLGATDFKQAFDPTQKDLEISNNLIWSDKFPDEIRSYLCMQFFDLFNHIKHNKETISQEEYQFLISRYVCEYDYFKVVNIVYQKFDEVD